MNYRREIDGLRALAVIPVILFHAGFQTFSGGFIGVDVFFVISGYLITSMILTEKQAGTFTLVGFYERRARRILPALFVVMFACLPFAWLWLTPKDMTDFSRSVVAVSGFASNILFFNESGYFNIHNELKPLLHTWSLAVEEQYYLLFPIFVLLTWRLDKRWSIGVLAIVAIISLAITQWDSLQDKSEFAFYMLPTRGWEILVGTFVAVFLFTRDPAIKLGRIGLQVGGIIGILLIACAVCVFDRRTPFPSLYALIPTVGAGLVILFATPQTLVGQILGSKMFVGIGLISYSAYLWHQPLFAFARHRSLDDPSTALLIALTAIAIVLGYLSWRYVETPFRNRECIKRKEVFIWGTLCSVLFMVFGFIGHFSEGYAYRVSAEVEELNPKNHKNPRHDECLASDDNYVAPKSSCSLGNEKSIVGFLLGDSHANAIAYSLEQALLESNIGMRELTFSGCPPVLNVYRANKGAMSRCDEYNRAAHDFLLSQNQDSYLVIVVRWTDYLNNYLDEVRSGNGEESGYEAYSDSIHSITNMEAVHRSVVMDGYRQTVLSLLNNNRKVILVYPIPEAGVDVPKYLSKKIMFQIDRGAGDLTTNYAAYKSGNEDAIIALDLIGEHKNLLRIMPDKILCDTFVKDRCVAQLNGVPLYHDDNHLSNAGARLVVNEIMKYINRYHKLPEKVERS
jgi:peptidoglycan/LPS O-acetylase OafA/YrhL